VQVNTEIDSFVWNDLDQADRHSGSLTENDVEYQSPPPGLW
jgi:hypothetical protein